MGTRYEVEILKWENPGHFWAREIPGKNMSPEAQTLQRMTEEMAQYAEDDVIPATRVVQPQRGKDYLGKCKDSKWYRVRIKDILQTRAGHHASCLKLDHGSTGHMIPLHNLRKMTRDFESGRLPYQAKQCKLYGVQPISLQPVLSKEHADIKMLFMPATKWDTAAKKYVEYHTKKCIAAPQIEPCNHNNEDIFYVRLFLNSPELGTFCLNDQLVKENFAQRIGNQQSAVDAKDSAHDVDKPTKTRRRSTKMKGLEEFLNPQGLDITRSSVTGGSGTAESITGESSPYNSCTESDRDSRVSMGSHSGKQATLSRLPRLIDQTSGESDNQTCLNRPGLGRGRGQLLLQESRTSSQESLGSISNPGSGSTTKTFTTLDKCVSVQGRGISMCQAETQASSTDLNVSSSMRSPGIQGGHVQTYGRGCKREAMDPIPSNSFQQSSPLTSNLGIGRGTKILQMQKSVHEEILSSSEVNIPSPPIGRGISRGSPQHPGSTSTPLGRGQILLGTSESSDSGQSFAKPQGLNHSPQDEKLSTGNNSNRGQNLNHGRQLQYSSSDESPQTSSKAKKKIVSFSDHEEYFSIPNRYSDAELYAQNEQTSVTPEKYSFVPKVVREHAELQGFAAAASYDACNKFSLKHHMIPDLPPEAYGVQVLGIGKPKFVSDIRAINFSEQVKAALSLCDIRAATTLQMYAWPALLRGRDVVGVASRGGNRRSMGKTTTYLAALLSELSHEDMYRALPISPGPCVLILAPSTNSVQTIQEQVYSLQNVNTHSSRHKVFRAIAIYPGGMEGDLEIDLLNGCDIIVATPHALLRMLEKNITSLDRLAHLVLEESEKLLEDFGEQVQEIMDMYQQVIDLRDEVTLPMRQVISMAAQWTPQVRQFAETYMQDPTVVITSKQECAFAGGVKQVALMMRSDQRLSHIASQLTETLRLKHKILICVEQKDTAVKIYQCLRNLHIITLHAHHEMVDLELDDVFRQWKLQHRPDSQPVFVVTDQALEGFEIEDVSCIINYDVPEKKSIFEDRLWCMRKAWKKPFEVSASEEPPCLSYLYMTEDRESVCANVMRLLKRSGTEIPPELQRYADRHQEKRERDTRSRLCANLKAFGYCRHENRCHYRHKIMHNLDYPGQNPKYIKVPMEGKVRIKVTYVVNATNYYGRLMSHMDLQDNVTDLSVDFTKITMDMSLYYGNPINRRVVESPENNMLYAWEDTQHVFSRVEVLQLSEANKRGFREKAVVYFVDTGERHEVNTVELLELPEHLCKDPYQAVEVFLCRVRPKDQDTAWPVAVSSRVAVDIQNKELDGYIALSLGCTLWLESLQYRTRLSNIQKTVTMFTVRGLLLEDRIAEENPDHMELLYEACKDRVDIPNSQDPTTSTTRAYTVHGKMLYPRVCELPVGEYIEVSVEATDSPNLLFVQNYSLRKEIEDFQYEILEYVRSNELHTPERLQTGTLILAEIPNTFGWYRGKILKDKGGDAYDVFFVDTGDEVEVKMSSILPLPSRFQSTQFYAIECCLVNVEPAGKEWPEEVGDWLYEKTRSDVDEDVYGKKLYAKVVRRAAAKHTGKYRYGLELYDTSLEYDVNLGHQLILEGQARLSSTTVQEMFAHLPQAPEGNLGNRVSEIIHCCHYILESQGKNHIPRSITIQKIIQEYREQPDVLVAGGVALALSYVLQFTRQAAVVDILVSSYVSLVRNLHRDHIQDQEMLAIGAMCWTLDVETGDVVRTLVWAFQELVKHKPYRCSMIEHGAIRILGQILDKNENPETDMLALKALEVLLNEINTKEDCNLVVRSQCLTVISGCVNKCASSEVVQSCLRIMESLAPKMRENIRKAGGVLAICSHLEDFTNPQVMEQAVLTLKALANNSRFNKDLMNEQKATNPLQKYAVDPELSQEVRSIATELCQRLRQLLPSNKSPSKRHCGQGSIGLEGHIISGTSLEGIRPLNQDIIPNTPLPPKFCSHTHAIKSARPQVKWAQDRWNMWLTVVVKDVRDPKVATFTEDTVTFRAISDSTEYYFEFHLYEVIKPSRCETHVTAGSVMLGLRKKFPGQWPRLCKDKHKLSYVVPDLEKFVYLSSDEEDEDDELTEEPKDGPLAMARMSYSRGTNLPSRPVNSAVAGKSAVRRTAQGLPAELVLGASSSEDDAEDSDDSLVGDFLCQDPNKKYDYFRL